MYWRWTLELRGYIVIVFLQYIFCRMPPKPKRARLTFRDNCQVCGANSPHVNKHMLNVHLPWCLNLATSCVDCHMSAGKEMELQNMHSRHQLFSGENLLQSWFLLLNELFLFISQEMGLGSPIELLGCAAVRELAPSTPRFSEGEYTFLREYDRRAGLEPITLGVYTAPLFP